MNYTYHCHATWPINNGDVGHTHGLITTKFRILTDDDYNVIKFEILHKIRADGANESNLVITSLCLLHTTSDHPPHG